MLLGFDIGGTKSAIVLGREIDDDPFEIMEKIILQTEGPPQQMINRLFEQAGELLGKHGLNNNEIRGIGISCGGPLDSAKGLILSPPNLPGWDRIPIVEMTEDRFNAKTVLQNDANACALAEWKMGAGKGFEHLIFLTFGTGMGAGLILNGRLYAGASDLAGEVGHIRLSENGPVGFGKSGSFEGFCSGGGIAQLARIKIREKWQTGAKVAFCATETELSKITAKMVADAAYAGDPLAKEVYRISALYLGRALALLIDILNPQIIILGSIYPRAQSLIESAMMEAIEKEAIPISAGSCRIVAAGLGESIGDMAALALASVAAKGGMK